MKRWNEEGHGLRSFNGEPGILSYKSIRLLISSDSSQTQSSVVSALTEKIDHFLWETRDRIYLAPRQIQQPPSLFPCFSFSPFLSVHASLWSAKDPITRSLPLIFSTWPSILSRIFEERWYYILPSYALSPWNCTIQTEIIFFEKNFFHTRLNKLI